jgi:predicted AlkP superfamily pyrophosphatase or phosphodiesterase
MRKMALPALALALAGSTPAQAAPLLLISIDGLRPADVIDAPARGLKVPVLRRFIDQGAYAKAVVGVLPTLTYPSHATLITGVNPGKHGIVNNLTFDPTGINQTGWYWYSSDIRVPTLWDAAHKAGLVTANVHWPVSAGAAIDLNLPQYWRTGHDDDRKLLRLIETPGLVEGLEKQLGAYAQGIDESVAGDAVRSAFAAKLIADRKPGFTTVYLAGLDHVEHEFGPDTPEAKAALEAIDAMVGRLQAAALAADPATVVAVVSDHGFAPVTTDVNLFGAFIQAGLIWVEGGKVTGWDAMPWIAGGSATVVLARPDDSATKTRVSGLLAQLKANPALGIAEVIDAAEVARRGGSGDFAIAFRPGFETGRDPAAAMTTPSKSKGMHGYAPSLPEMRSAFMVMGRDVKLKGDLGEIDMRRIAPTLAGLMGASLPTAELPAIGK